MTNAVERIRELHERYMSARATEAELTELFALADEPANEPVFAALFSDRWDEFDQVGRELARLKETPVRRISPFQRWGWVAAAVLILLGTGGYFWFRGPAKDMAENTPPPSRENEIAPGGNRAVLTLAGGQKIILDSAQTGRLTTQGNTAVSKTGTGQLTYKIENENSSQVLYNTLTTPRGGQYQLTLPDGTKVWLNASSSITYPTAFIGKERLVTLAGEAYFEVAASKERPFRVKVGAMNVDVLGTHFNINAYENEDVVRTTLLEGKVKVSQGSSTQLLQPGQQAQLSGKTLTVTEAVDPQAVIAWKNGYFNFNGADIGAIMRQVERWYDVTVVFDGKPPTGNYRGKTSRNMTAAQILKVLQESGIQFSIEDKTIHVK